MDIKGSDKMNAYGYTRTSTPEQHLDRGIKEINDFCKNSNINLVKIYFDQITGKNFNRPRYIVLKEDILRPGDILIVPEMDRLGRNKKEILIELQYFKEKKIRVMILEIPTTLIDLSMFDEGMAKMMLETINNMLIELYATFAQTEIEKKEKRQREGIEAMKARGEWNNYGRPKAIDEDKFKKEYQRVLDGKIAPFALMRELGMTRPTFYRYKKNLEEEKKR